MLGAAMKTPGARIIARNEKGVVTVPTNGRYSSASKIFKDRPRPGSPDTPNRRPPCLYCPVGGQDEPVFGEMGRRSPTVLEYNKPLKVDWDRQERRKKGRIRGITGEKYARYVINRRGGNLPVQRRRRP